MRDLIKLKTEDDIKRIRESGKIISGIFKSLSKISMDGMSTLDVDSYVDDAIIKAKARPSFKTVKNYKHATCISVNEEVVHGIPLKKKKIKKGDIVKVDIGVVKNGFFADACYTYCIKPIPANAAKIVAVAKEALDLGVSMARAGNRLGDIGAVIQELVEKNGFSVVRDFTGHGVGFAVHELPNIPHYGRRGSGLTLKEGMVLAIEPMINEGTYNVVTLDDGWTSVTEDGLLSAQFEHTVAITADSPLILTV